MKIDAGIGYREAEKAINQVLDYTMGYRRSGKGMETALEKLELIDTSRK